MPIPCAVTWIEDDDAESDTDVAEDPSFGFRAYRVML